MMSLIKSKNWAKWKLIISVPFFMVTLQSFKIPDLIVKTGDIIPQKFKENKVEDWLSKWTVENIGKGFFQPELESPDASRKPNNVLEILMNRNDKFLIENQFKEKKEVKQIVKNYLHGINPDGKKGPDYAEKEIPYVGKMKVSKGIIIFRHDLASSNEMVNYSLRSIGEACLEVRKEKAQILFGTDYFDLDLEKQLAINKAMPVWFFYEFPKSPTPNVWLPFDEKPSKPDPFKITFQRNGNVIVENHKFDSFAEFEENLKYWNEELDKFYKTNRIKGYYRANVVFDSISRADQKDISYWLHKNNVQVEHVKNNPGFKMIDITLKPDNDNPDLEKIRTKAKKDLEIYNDDLKVLIQYFEGVTKEQVKSVRDVFLDLGVKDVEVRKFTHIKPALPLFLMRLYPGEIQNALKDEISLDAVSAYAESWLKKVGTDYSASIYVYQNVSEEHILQLKQEMQKGGIKKEITIKKM